MSPRFFRRLPVVFALAQNAWLEQVRHRVFYVILVFGGVVLYSALLLGVMAVEQELRVLTDLGLSLLDIFGLILSLFGASTLVLQEMQNKTIYLILTRPVKRYQYLLGRYLGLVGVVWTSLLGMALLHLLLLFWRGWQWNHLYIWMVAFSAMKVLMLCGLAVAFSLFTTSLVSSLSITFILWILGHFWNEIRFLMDRLPPHVSWLFRVMGPFIPNFQILNLRDFWESASVPWTLWVGAAGYALAYSIACLAFAALLFEKKEF